VGLILKYYNSNSAVTTITNYKLNEDDSDEYLLSLINDIENSEFTFNGNKSFDGQVKLSNNFIMDGVDGLTYQVSISGGTMTIDTI
jgi:hypothetical protein